MEQCTPPAHLLRARRVLLGMPGWLWLLLETQGRACSAKETARLVVHGLCVSVLMPWDLRHIHDTCKWCPHPSHAKRGDTSRSWSCSEGTAPTERGQIKTDTGLGRTSFSTLKKPHLSCLQFTQIVITRPSTTIVQTMTACRRTP